MNKTTLILLILALSACTSSSKKPAENMYYRFPEVTLQPLANLNIEVKRPSAMGILGNRPMVVQTQDASLIQMSNNFWLDSPKVLLHNYLSEVFVSNKAKDALILNSQILALEKKQDVALLSVKFSIIDIDKNLKFEKTYKSQKRINDKSIASFSNAISVLLEEMISQLSTDIE